MAEARTNVARAAIYVEERDWVAASLSLQEVCERLAPLLHVASFCFVLLHVEGLLVQPTYASLCGWTPAAPSS